jgi:hypothetical protein
MEKITPTEYRKLTAANFGAQLGLDPDELYEGAMAAWSNLNPDRVPFDHALSVAGVALRAAQEVRNAARTADPRVDALVAAIEATANGDGIDVLDNEVHDAKGEEAAEINNSGYEAQVRYLLEGGTTIDHLAGLLGIDIESEARPA